jgi:hypothetical protein
VKISRPEEYKLFLRLQVKQFVKDPKKVEILVEEYYLAFCDGIKFGQGKLVIDDD